MKLSVIGGLTQAEGEALGAFTSSGDLGVHGGMLENGPHLACSACVAPRPHSSAPLLPQLPGTGGVRLHMSPSRPTSTTPRPFLMTLPSVSLADHASRTHTHTRTHAQCSMRACPHTHQVAHLTRRAHACRIVRAGAGGARADDHIVDPPVPHGARAHRRDALGLH